MFYSTDIVLDLRKLLLIWFTEDQLLNTKKKYQTLGKHRKKQ